MTDLDEQALVIRAQEDPQAFGALYDRYFDRIYGFIYRRVSDQGTAEDLTSATFERALRHIGRFEWRGAGFGAWLYQIARNRIASHYRNARLLAPLDRLRGREYGRKNRPAFAEHFALAEELAQGLEKLSAGDQEVIALRLLEDFSSAEVAEFLDCSIETVYLRLHRALKRLRALLEEDNDEERNQ